MQKGNRKIIYWIGLCAVLALSCAIFLWFYRFSQNKFDRKNIPVFTNEGAYFVPLQIDGFNSAHIPYFRSEIGKQSVNLKIDLGFSGTIAIPEWLINKLEDKEMIDRSIFYSINGKKYSCDIYKIKQCKIGNISFFPIEAKEINSEFESDVSLKSDDILSNNMDGRLGWHFFRNLNVLIDCKNSILALCDSLDTLKSQGYFIDSFTEAPLILDSELIEFEAMTNRGVLRCALDSGCTMSILNKELEAGDNNDHMIFTSETIDQHAILNPENKDMLVFDLQDVCEIPVFQIGGKDFGPMTFNRIKSPFAIDALIGMEFIEDTLIYIDFANSKIYFYPYPDEESHSG